MTASTIAKAAPKTATKATPKPRPAGVRPAPKPMPAPVVVPDTIAAPAETKASVKESLALTNGTKKAHSFRLKTLEIAVANGYRVSTEAPFDNVVLFEKGDVKLRVTYSVQDYVRKVEGSFTLERDDKLKWKTLNAKLVELA